MGFQGYVSLLTANLQTGILSLNIMLVFVFVNVFGGVLHSRCTQTLHIPDVLRLSPEEFHFGSDPSAGFRV